MSDNEINNEDLIPAKLVEGEKVISDEQVESVKKLIENYGKATKSEKNVEDDVISSPEPVADGKPSITYNKDGIMSSGTKEEKPKTKSVSAKKEKTVALYSTRNVNWVGVGKLKKGYNIVLEAESKKWLQRDHVRLVDPTEMKRELDN